MAISIAAIKLNPAPLTTAQIDAAFVSYIQSTVFPEEGGYTDDPNDSGGETNFGITIAIARQWGYDGSMRDLTAEEALDIYRKNDWHGPGFDALAAVNLPLAIELLDLGINMGDGTAAKFLQQMLAALSYYSGAIDGQFGPKSCAGVAQLLAKRGQDGLRVLFCGVRAQACIRYIAIAQAQPKDEEYIFGWLSNRAFPPVTA